MSDRRLKSPRLMSKNELAEHMRSHHGSNRSDRWAHNHAHSVSLPVIRHGHRSARLSEIDHPDWLGVS